MTWGRKTSNQEIFMYLYSDMWSEKSHYFDRSGALPLMDKNILYTLHHHGHCPPPKINIEPENDGLEDDFPSPGVWCILMFQPLISRGVSQKSVRIPFFGFRGSMIRSFVSRNGVVFTLEKANRCGSLGKGHLGCASCFRDFLGVN